MEASSGLSAPLWPIPLRNAAIGGLLSILMFITLNIMGKNPLVNIKFFNSLLLIIFIPFTIKEYQSHCGAVPFWKGMSVGFIHYLPFALLSASCIYITLYWIKPGLLEQYVAERTAEIMLSRDRIVETIDETAYRDALQNIGQATAAQVAMDDFLKNSIAGLFIAIIVSVIFKAFTIKNK